jgi:NTE family protein
MPTTSARRTIRGALDQFLDVFRIRQYFDAITVARELAEAAGSDGELVRRLGLAVLPLPEPLRRPHNPRPFGTFKKVRVLSPGRRVAVVATGGSGAMSALVGVLRACEEAGIRPSSMAVASGAALFGFPFGAGLSAGRVADFTLSLQPRDYVDVDWAGLAGILPRLGRGFAGVVKGDRLEAAYRELLGDLRLGEMPIPTYAPLWNIDENRVEYIGPRTYPELTVARAIRLSVSLPLFMDPQPMNGSYWGDGGIVDIFPVHPVLDLEPKPDAVLALNCFYPPAFRGEDVSGWRRRTFSIFHAAAQVRTAQQAQLARQNLARLRAEVGDVLLLEPVPYTEVQGGRFYIQFVDNSSWPGFMKAGRSVTLRALRQRRTRLLRVS